MSPSNRGGSRGGFREEVFNVFLAILLNERGIVSIPENIQKIAKTRRVPDILITEFLGVSVIIEGRIDEAHGVATSLTADSKKRIEEGLSAVCLAVLYPPELRTANWPEIKTRLENAQLRVKVLTDSYEGEWVYRDIDGLAAVLRRTYELLVREDVVSVVVEKIKIAIEEASACLLEIQAIPDRLRTILGVFGERNAKDARKDNQRVCRIATLTLANALIFQEVLASIQPTVKTVRRVLDESNLVTAFSQVWKHILEEINYMPIFRVAREILLELPSEPGTERAVRILARVALETTKQRAALKHDLMGRIYHRLLVDAKFFGVYYTTIPAATLLLELTFDPRYWEIDFSDKNEIRSLRMADMACGTGTLLKAALEAIVDDYVKAVIESEGDLEVDDLHKVLVEETLWGFDVLPFAAHLAASALALHEPNVPFDNMNLYVLPLGGRNSRLGSLDFLESRAIPLQMDLFGALSGPQRVTGQGDKSVAIKMLDLDLCVMNPPFTRSVGGNLLFGAYPSEQRRGMQHRLRNVIRQNKVLANTTAGLGSVFVALADKYLKENGHLALVLPKSLLSGVAWKPTRRLILNRYAVRYIIVSHQPNGWNFSENTNLSECLVVADGLGNSKATDCCTFVNLWLKPRSNIEALTLSSIIMSANPAKLDDVGICELKTEDVKYGESTTIPLSLLKGKSWMFASSFAQTELVRAAYYLSKGELYLPNQGIVAKISLISIGNLFTLGFDQRDIHDGFEKSLKETSYPAFWGHNSTKVKSINQEPNRYLIPLSRAKPGRPLRKANWLWKSASDFLIAERLWTKTHRLVSVVCDRKVLSTWWTASQKREAKDLEEDTLKKISCLWLNSTLGIISLLTTRAETRGAWIKFKKPNLESLPILDPTSLKVEQKEAFLQLFNEVSSKVLLPLENLKIDKARQCIDDGISKILNLPNYEMLRKLLAKEPSVTLQPL